MRRWLLKGKGLKERSNYAEIPLQFRNKYCDIDYFPSVEHELWRIYTLSLRMANCAFVKIEENKTSEEIIRCFHIHLPYEPTIEIELTWAGIKTKKSLANDLEQMGVKYREAMTDCTSFTQHYFWAGSNFDGILDAAESSYRIIYLERLLSYIDENSFSELYSEVSSFTEHENDYVRSMALSLRARLNLNFGNIQAALNDCKLSHSLFDKHKEVINEGSYNFAEQDCLWVITSIFDTWTIASKYAGKPTQVPAELGIKQLDNIFWKRKLKLMGWERSIYKEKLCRDANNTGIDFEDLKSSLHPRFPFFNDLDNDGIPIPGKHSWPEKNVMKQILRHGPAYSRVYGLTLNKSGEVVVHGEQDRSCLPLVYEVDLYAIFCSIYLDNRLPAFGLPSSENLAERFHYPDWTGSTPLGEALFLSDYLLFQLLSKNALQSLYNPEVSSSIDQNSKHPKLLKEIANIARRDRPPTDTDGGRFCITMKTVEIIEGTTSDGQYFGLGAAKPFIENAFYKPNSNGKEDIYLNDANYAQGANFFSKNYETISSLFPHFRTCRESFVINFIS